MHTLDKFTCALYGDLAAQTVNDARYNLFTHGKFAEYCLPPNNDVPILHINRSNYVSFIWHHCLNRKIGAPDFRNHGWKVGERGKVRVKWLCGLPVMDTILESANCKCKAGSKSKRCSCKKEGLECTEVCGCADCQNHKYANMINEDDDDDLCQEDIEIDDTDTEYLG